MIAMGDARQEAGRIIVKYFLMIRPVSWRASLMAIMILNLSQKN
jgi:hypothetical protein